METSKQRVESRLKFSGSHIEIPAPLNLGDEVIYRGNGSVTNEINRDNEDDTFISIYTVRPVFVELEALRQGENIPYLKTKAIAAGPKSRSKKLREMIYRYWQQELSGKYPKFDVYYHAYMDKLINYVEELLT